MPLPAVIHWTSPAPSVPLLPWTPIWGWVDVSSRLASTRAGTAGRRLRGPAMNQAGGGTAGNRPPRPGVGIRVLESWRRPAVGISGGFHAQDGTDGPDRGRIEPDRGICVRAAARPHSRPDRENRWRDALAQDE